MRAPFQSGSASGAIRRLMMTTRAIFRVELTVSTTWIIKPLRSIHSNTSMDPNDRRPMTGTARDDAAAASEQDELISCLERIQESFERRALS